MANTLEEIEPTVKELCITRLINNLHIIVVGGKLCISIINWLKRRN